MRKYDLSSIDWDSGTSTGSPYDLTSMDWDSGAPEESSFFGDLGRAYMAGSASLAEAAGYGLETLGADTFGGWLRERARDSRESWESGYSDEFKAARQKEFVTQDAAGDYSFGDAWTDPRAIGGALVQSVPGTMLGMGLGGALAKGFSIVPQIGPKVAGVLGYGTGEAAVASLSAGSNTYEEVLRMPQEVLEQSPEYQAALAGTGNVSSARELVARAAGEDATALTALTTFVLSAPAGAVLGKFTAGLPLATTRARSVAVGFGAEGAQEFLQSGAEQLSQNIAIRDNADPTRDAEQGVLNQAVGGMFAGGLMGAAVGAASPLDRAPGTPADEPGAKASTTIDDIANDLRRPYAEAAEEGANQARDIVAQSGGDALSQELAASDVVWSAISQSPTRDDVERTYGRQLQMMQVDEQLAQEAEALRQERLKALDQDGEASVAWMSPGPDGQWRPKAEILPAGKSAARREASNTWGASLENPTGAVRAPKLRSPKRRKGRMDLLWQGQPNEMLGDPADAEEAEAAAAPAPRWEPTGNTVERVMADLSQDADIGSALGTLTSSRALNIVQSPDQLPPEVQAALSQSAETGAPQGLVWKGRMWLVADSIEAGRARGVLLHEGQHYAMERRENSETYKTLQSNFDRLLESGDVNAVRAMRRVQSANTADVEKERVAYFLEEVVNNPDQASGRERVLAARIMQDVRLWFRETKVGKWLEAHGAGFNLTPQEIVQIVKRGMIRQAQTEARTAAPGGLQASRQEMGAPAGQTLAPTLARSDTSAEVEQDAGSEFRYVSGRPRKTPATNYVEALSTYSPTVYRETNLEEADALLPGSNSARDAQAFDGLFASESAELALGQGRNTGVVVELDTRGLKGQISRSKPTADVAWQSGQAEFVLKRNTQAAVRDAVRSVTVRNDAKGPKWAIARTKAQLNRLVAEQGWTKEETDAGVVYRAPAMRETSADGVPQFSRRRKPDPKKTVKAYKLFRVDPRKPGRLFPLFVNANDPVEMGVWLDADIGPSAAGGKVKSKLGPLAFRPGWHAGDVPIATHIGGKSSPDLTAPDTRPDNQVWAEVEMAADRDWQAEADKRGTNAQGKIVPVKAHITDQIPEDGFYRYKTNANMTGNWLIGGSMKVTRILPDAEVDAINAAAGVSDLPRKQPFDAEKYGFGTKLSRQRGINVRNDGDNRYADLIVDGEKTMESRDSDSLRPYVGQAVGIIRTGEGPAKLIGSVKVGEPIEVGEQKFRELEAEHLVPAGSAFDIKPGRTKFLYPLTEAKRFDGERDVESRGIVARNVQFSRRQTETPEFKRWFGDSKVVDADGKPLVVYHGYTGDVTDTPSGPIYLAYDEDVAQEYSELTGSGSGYSAYVSLQNPLILRTGGDVRAVWEDSKALTVDGPFYPDQQSALNEWAEKQGHDGIMVEPSAFEGDVGYEWAAGTFGEPQIVVFEPKNVKSIENQGTFDPENPNIRFSRRQTDRPVPDAVRQAASLEASFEHVGSTSYARNRDLKVSLQSFVKDAARQARIDLTERTPEVRNHLVRAVIADAKYALRANENAIGWYDRTLKRALKTLSGIHPELETDEQARFAFTWALAVTSNGMKVDKNFELAEQAYAGFKATGRMPVNVGEGTAAGAINDGLAMYNTLVDQLGEETVRKLMVTEFTVKELTDALGVDITGELMDTRVRGAAILGPKIGNGFFSNLYGFYDALTMDRWLMRTWGRWTGTLIDVDPDKVAKARTRLREVRDAVMADPSARTQLKGLLRGTVPLALDKFAKAISKQTVKKEFRASLNLIEAAGWGSAKGDTAGAELRKAANALSNALDGQKESPGNGSERNWIREVFNQALTELKAEYPDLTMSDLQALLWYPEKKLYESSKTDETAEGYEEEAAPDYANAAAKLARKKGVDVDGRTAGTGSGVAQSAPGEQEPGRGFAPQERTAFLVDRFFANQSAELVGTQETQTLLTPAGASAYDAFTQLAGRTDLRSAKARADYVKIQRQTMRELSKKVGGKPSPLAQLISAITGVSDPVLIGVDTNASGTFDSVASPNMRLPMRFKSGKKTVVLTRDQVEVMLAVLGLELKQAAQAASSFKTVSRGAEDTYSVLVEAPAGEDISNSVLQQLDMDLGFPLSYARVPLGWQIDVNIGGFDTRPTIEQVGEAFYKAFGEATIHIVPRAYDSIYLEAKDYGDVLDAFQRAEDPGAGARGGEADGGDGRLGRLESVREAIRQIAEKQDRQLADWDAGVRRRIQFSRAEVESPSAVDAEQVNQYNPEPGAESAPDSATATPLADIQITDDYVIAETGETVSVTERADIRLRQLDKRLAVARRLVLCLGG